MKLLKIFLATIFLCFLISVGSAGAQEILKEYPELKQLADFVGVDQISILHLTAYKAANFALKELKIEKGSKDLLVITDAGYMAKIGEYSTEKALDGVMFASGASRTKGNLVVVHRSFNDPLWFAFFDKKSNCCIYMEVNSSLLKLWLEHESSGKVNLSEFMKIDLDLIFKKISKVEIDPDVLITEDGAKAWHNNFVNKTLGGNEFSIVTIVAVWKKGMSYELLKAAEFHNHICPGLISGLYIAEYLNKYHPINLSKGENWVVWALPPWCKDDALQQVLDSTVGKRRMAVMYIPSDIKEKMYDQYKSIAGIYVKIDKSGNAKAIVIGWNWSKVFKDCNVKREYFKDFKTYRWWWARLRCNVLMLDHKPEEYVSVLRVIDLGNQGSIKKMNAKWMKVGFNPLEELDLMPKVKKEEVIEVIPAWVYAVIGLNFILVAIVVYCVVKLKKLRR